MYAFYGIVSNANNIKKALTKFSKTYNNALSGSD